MLAMLSALATGCGTEEHSPEVPKSPSGTSTVEQGNCIPSDPVITASSQQAECSDLNASIFIDPQVSAACDLTPQVSFSLNGNAIADPHEYPWAINGGNIHQVRITAVDDIANRRATRTVNVQVVDTIAPVINAGGDRTIECSGLEGTQASLNTPVVTDSCDDSVIVRNDAPEDNIFQPGTTRVTLTATDRSDNQSSAFYNVIVQDTDPPTVITADDLIVPSASNCNFNNQGPNTGTTVTVPLPQVSDTCTRPNNIVVTNSITNDTRQTLCIANVGATTITFTAIDGSGNQGTSSMNILAVDARLPVSITNNPVSGFTNGNVTVGVSVGGGALAPINWFIYGGAAPTTPPGNGQTATAVFSTEASYCPLFIAATDGRDDAGANADLCFGIERTAPSVTFDSIPTRFLNPDNPNEDIDVDRNNQDTWPVFFVGEHIRADMLARDDAGSVNSGVRRIQLILDPNNSNRLIINHEEALSGEPAAGQETVSINGCDTNDAACRDDGQIEVGELGLGPRQLQVRVTDAAGNVAIKDLYIRVRNYGGVLGDLQAWTSAVAANSPLRSRQALQKAETLFASGQALFSSAPGYAFLISRRAMLRLDDAARDGANVSSLKRIISRAVTAEVTRLTNITQSQGFSNWRILGDTGLYNDRILLTGRVNNFTVEVDPTLTLAKNLANEARSEYEGGQHDAALQTAIKAFNQLAILYDDEVWAQAFNRPPFRIGNNSERILNGSQPFEFGLPIAKTLRAQVERIAANDTVPNDVTNDLNTLRDLMTTFEQGVLAVNNEQFSNGFLLENIYIPAIQALELFDTMQESHVYTHYWRAAMVYVLAFVTNFSLYEGPTSIVRTYLDRANEDPFVQVSECRYDKAMQALADGRLETGVVAAADQFIRSKCLAVHLYNSYYPGTLNREEFIPPGQYGCPVELPPVDAGAECPCGLGQQNNNDSDALCDGVDSDCDGSIDEGYIPEACGQGGCANTSRCINGQVSQCTPFEPRNTVDNTCDGVDDDCDGDIDDDYVVTTCGQLGCQRSSRCEDGSEVACLPGQPEPESCDNLDNDCDGLIDEGVDSDRDGYGTGPNCGCANGCNDCDDTNPLVNPGAAEVCDDIDNNCNNVNNEGVLNACGNCNPGCSLSQFGVGEGRIPFNPTPNNSTNTDLDDDGQVQLTTDNINVTFAWFVSSLGTTANSIYKVDTTTGNQVGRYPTGSNPSRTTVDDKGNVFVANRSSQNLTKIANWTTACDRDVQNCECVDRNNNNRIETSKDTNGNGKIDNNEYLGTSDECYIFTTAEASLGYLPRSLAIDAQGFIWAGNWSTEPRVYKIDPDTGATLTAVRTSIRTYGSVIDGSGMLWFIDRTSNIQGINTANNSLTPVYATTGQSYGIALNNDYVFIASLWGQHLVRVFSPSRRQVFQGPVGGAFRQDSRGLTVLSDAVTVCSTHWTEPANYVQCWNIEDSNNDGAPQLSEFSRTKDVFLENCDGTLGIGVGANDVNWVACYYSGTTAAFSPDPNINTVNYHPVGTNPYTYSDFTGNIRSTFTAPRGEYTQEFNGCPNSEIETWDRVEWAGNVPADTRVEVYVKVAASQGELGGAQESGPFTANAIDISDLASLPFISVRFRLISDRNGAIPRISSLNVTRYCAVDLNNNQ
jgi:streptogramin lyase